MIDTFRNVEDHSTQPNPTKTPLSTRFVKHAYLNGRVWLLGHKMENVCTVVIQSRHEPVTGGEGDQFTQLIPTRTKLT